MYQCDHSSQAASDDARVQTLVLLHNVAPKMPLEAVHDDKLDEGLYYTGRGALPKPVSERFLNINREICNAPREYDLKNIVR